jgi:hypothetical protein
VLDRHSYKLWYNMPVPGGYGASSLDFLGCCMGDFFAIETKAPGEKASQRQAEILSAIEMAGGMCFVIDGPRSLELLDVWLRDRDREGFE